MTPRTAPTSGCRCSAPSPGQARCSGPPPPSRSSRRRPRRSHSWRRAWSWGGGGPVPARSSPRPGSCCSPPSRSPPSVSTRSSHNPLAALAAERATVSVDGSVASDPVLLTSGRTDLVMWRMRVVEVRARGRTTTLGAPVLVLSPPDSTPPALGATVRVTVGSRRPTATTSRARAAGQGGPGSAEGSRSLVAWCGGGPAVPARLGRAPPRGPARAGARPGRGRRLGSAAAGRGRLQDHRAHPPARGVGDQPHPGRRLPARPGQVVPGPWPLAGSWWAQRAWSGSCCSRAPNPASCAPR